MKAIFEKLLVNVISPFILKFDSFEGMHGSLLSKITNNIYLGARPKKTSVPGLRNAGITHVVSCLDEENRSRIDFLKKILNICF